MTPSCCASARCPQCFSARISPMLFKLLFVLFMFPLALRAADEVELASDRNGDGTKAFSYVVPMRIIDRQPSWTPGTQPCPLPLEAAFRVALAWLAHQPWKDSVHVRSISLSRDFHSRSAHWYYSFLFDDRVLDETPSPSGVIRAKHPSSLIVLLDGFIVQPKDVRHRPKK